MVLGDSVFVKNPSTHRSQSFSSLRTCCPASPSLAQNSNTVSAFILPYFLLSSLCISSPRLSSTWVLPPPLFYITSSAVLNVVMTNNIELQTGCKVFCCRKKKKKKEKGYLWADANDRVFTWRKLKKNHTNKDGPKHSKFKHARSKCIKYE